MDIKEINIDYVSERLQSIVDNIKFNEMHINCIFRHGFSYTTLINIGPDTLYTEYGETKSINGELIRVCNVYSLDKEQVSYIEEVISNVVIELAKLSKYDEVNVQIELKDKETGNILYMMVDELLNDKSGFYTDIVSRKKYNIGNLTVVHTKFK